MWRADFLVRGVFGFMVMVSCAWLSMAAPQATGAGTAQDAKDVCAPVQAAYQKTASASNSIRQSGLIVGSPSRKIRSSMANDAAFEPTDRNAVTGVGAPS